jgi:hypothetical protein
LFFDVVVGKGIVFDILRMIMGNTI